MIIAILSVLILASIIWVLNKILPIKICPICAGVSLTWLWMLLGMGYGLLSVEKYQFIAAILMGGSVIGIVNKLEEKWRGYKKNKLLNSKNLTQQELEEKLKDCC